MSVLNNPLIFKKSVIPNRIVFQPMNGNVAMAEAANSAKCFIKLVNLGSR